ncbi:MAG: prephenate dehydrogenase, partial [Candidatus Delongbacteria bacterium]|nr:prephenate dehydrogenase [Candidatus Delongbacteria bacterium]
MNIVILGTGHLGSWLAAILTRNTQHKVAVYDISIDRCQKLDNVEILNTLDEIGAFKPEIVINAVSLNKTKEVFDAVLPFLSEDCMISDVASVKTGLADYYDKIKRPYVSTHPMFGPTFANFKNLSNENAIIITEGCIKGKEFFKGLYKDLSLNIFEYSFVEHDRTIAYSLGTPFTATMVFSACMEKQDAPGTTFRKHMLIAEGLLKEDDYLLA